MWRAYFAGDRAALEKLLPEELLTLELGGEWGNRKAVFEGSARFAAGGGKLVRLEFPKTEMQVYGPTAIVYSSYLYEIEQGGKRSVNTGRVTEVFVNRNGTWVSEDWHWIRAIRRVVRPAACLMDGKRIFNAETQRTRRKRGEGTRCVQGLAAMIRLGGSTGCRHGVGTERGGVLARLTGSVGRAAREGMHHPRSRDGYLCHCAVDAPARTRSMG